VIPGPLILRGDARALPLPDESVDLIATSPPYFGLRDYGHDTQIGAESTPQEFIAALVECTREMVRVLKPSGSIFVNLGDKYNSAASGQQNGHGHKSGLGGGRHDRMKGRGTTVQTIPQKSLMLLPERYRIACVDELGLIARAVLVWSKINSLPESVTDRVRRSHEDWVHLTRSPRYFAAVDEIREPHNDPRPIKRGSAAWDGVRPQKGDRGQAFNPLGKLPGSVWEIATQPLRVPAELGIDHFAAYPMEWPRRLILGWSPREVCAACGEGRRPVTERTGRVVSSRGDALLGGSHDNRHDASRKDNGRQIRAAAGPSFPKHEATIAGYACGCPDTAAPSTPGVVLDPFGGTGTTALVAAMHGRQGISVDASADYCRLAEWRASDPKERARAAGLDPDAVAKVPAQRADQYDLLEMLGDPA